MVNRTKSTPKRLKSFLAVLSTTASVTEAARHIGMSRRYMYTLREADSVFAAKWDSAIEQGTDALEDEARRRAVDGVEEPVYHQGVQCGTTRRYSDNLLTLLLKARRPEKYRERTSTELTGKGGEPISIRVVFVDRKDDSEHDRNLPRGIRARPGAL